MRILNPHPRPRRFATPATTLMTIFTAAMCVIIAPTSANAFCGFYVSGADAKLFNNATQVVMMRDGERTVLSMQNNYQGPPEDFAMVIPVPVVLQKENVKTLPTKIFDDVDAMASPRLVEYWERDPCWRPPVEIFDDRDDDGVVMASAPIDGAPGEGGVRVEAQFEVGEYEIVILSADDSGALDSWLKAQDYNIPAGAEPVLRPYVEAGTKFFVAKVNSSKVSFKADKATLSPLRFHYDSADFSLPVRLGMLNAKGPQDLIVHILARGQRYEVANYKNVTIPTNIGVGEDAKERFGEFYAALFDRTLERNEGAVITEYAWDAGSCDPCPGPTLSSYHLATLGADLLQDKSPWGFVLTRLHARYTREDLGEDLVFKAAPPIVGGREFYKQGKELEKGSTPASINNFQGRYIIRHPWEGPVRCLNPVYGRWDGPPPEGASSQGTITARDLAETPRGAISLTEFVRQDVPEIEVQAASAVPFAAPPQGDIGPAYGCACATAARAPSTGGQRPSWLTLAMVLSVVGVRLRRSSRRRRESAAP